jgi:hypothetical protein
MARIEITAALCDDAEAENSVRALTRGDVADNA